MTAADLLQEIEKGNIFPVYLIMGDNAYTQDFIITSMKKHILTEDFGSFNFLQREKMDSVNELLDVANCLPAFSDRRLIIVNDENIFNANRMTESDLSILSAYLDNPNETTCLVFLVRGTVDKRGKLYKKFVQTAKVTEVDALKGSMLLAWIRREFSRFAKKPDNQLVNFLATISNENLYFLQGEIAKIVAYVGEKETISLEEVRDVLAKTVDCNIFQMIDYLMEGNLNRALSELNNIMDAGEPLVRINYMIARHFRFLLDARLVLESGGTERDLAPKLKKQAFLAPKFLRQARDYSQEKLTFVYKKLLEVDVALKSSTSKSKRILEVVLIEIANIQKGQL